MESNLWVEKYRPQTIDEMVLNDDVKNYFKNMVKSGNVINMTFLGQQGSGKTTIAKAIANELQATTLVINCAVEGTVDVAKTKLQDFCNAMSLDGTLKIVILDEIDSASSTSDSSFQKSLRNIIESAADDCRFILTGNYNKIIPAVLSRCPVVKLSFNQRDLLIRIKHILDIEKIKYTKESLKDFINFAFKFYPDVRRVINYLQSTCSTGELVIDSGTNASDTDIKSFVKDLVEKIKAEKDVLAIRQFVIQNKSKFNDNYLELGSNLFNYVVENEKIASESILQAADIIYKMGNVVDMELQMFALCVCIKKSI